LTAALRRIAGILRAAFGITMTEYIVGRADNKKLGKYPLFF